MITSIEKLSKILNIKPPLLKSKAPIDFPLQVPKSFIKNVKEGDLNDPLLLQILPREIEMQKKVGYSDDPLFERENSPVKGLIHKYYGRVLLLVTNKCAVNCRFCFRRHSRSDDGTNCFFSNPESLNVNLISLWRSYIEKDQSIKEVILSGGDPLMLKLEYLNRIIEELAEISHVERIRIHSRVPVVMPELVVKKTIASKLPLIIVVHCNHPNEISDNVKKCVAWFRKQDVTILNQTVLLRGINDSSEALISLSEKLFEVGVIPYYLHILDKVQGAAHFYVGLQKAKRIHRKLQENLPGYLVPRLILDGEKRKRHV